MTNQEFANCLEALASKYEILPDTFKQPVIAFWAWDKSTLQVLIRTLGGRWTKADTGDGYMKLTSESFACTIKVPKDTICCYGSSQQNRYYRGVVVKMIADELGYLRPDDVHEALKLEFLRVEADPEHGKPFAYGRSTTTLKTDEFEDYLERIRIWAASFCGLIIPKPNEILEA